MKNLKKGQRVKLTALGVKNGFDKRSVLGVLKSDQKNEMMSVLRDGYKRPERFHEDFWRPVAPDTESDNTEVSDD